jgi:hypothetical protein
MEECVSTYRSEYVKDLTKRLGLDKNILPPAYGVSTLLNPLFGSKKLIVGCCLMTEAQYDNARKALLSRIQDIYESFEPTVVEFDEDSVNSLDEDVSIAENNNHRKAEDELKTFEWYKKQKFQPILSTTMLLSGVDGDSTITRVAAVQPGKLIKLGVGSVSARRQDLPSGKNLADYIDKDHRMDILRFLSDHRTIFPSLFKIAQCEASRQTEEVGCERFFGLTGYVSAPRRSNLGVKNYERLSLLADILPKLYINPSDIATQYLMRCESGSWKKENTMDSLKCFNLERIIEAEVFNTKMPEPVPIETYMKQYQEDCGDSSSDSS